MYKLIVAGSRDFTEYNLLEDEVSKLICKIGPEIEIVSGGARGADALGETFADKHSLPCKVFPAKWGLHGKKAGPLRNIEMGNYADGLIVFIKNNSKGSTHMLEYMRRLGKDTVEIKV